MSQEVDDLVAAVKDLSAAVAVAIAKLSGEQHDPPVIEGAANQVKQLTSQLTAATVAATPAPVSDPAASAA